MKLNPTGITPAHISAAPAKRAAVLNGPTSNVPNERRRRGRTYTKMAGYILPENALADDANDDPWEVRVTDFTRFGAAFVTGESLALGAFRRLRIGAGPMKLARRMRVVHCQPNGPALFRIGVEFA